MGLQFARLESFCLLAVLLVGTSGLIFNMLVISGSRKVTFLQTN